MRLEYENEKEMKRQAIGIFAKYLDISRYKVFIFGSRASGKGDERSDIDIGIQGLQKIPLEAMAKIREEIEELPILYKIDVVDFTDASEQFKQVALKSVEHISIAP